MKKVLFLILTLFITIQFYGQQEITVGKPMCGISITKNAPANYDYVLDKKNSWVTMLYSASRIGASGEIKGVAFFADCTVTDNCTFDEAKNQKVYIKEVDETQFTSTSEPDLSSYTLVYDGKITWRRGKGNIENSKTQIIFQTPFKYSGNKTLAIYFLNENNQALGGFSGCGASPPFLWDYAGENTVIYENFKQGEKSGSGNFDKGLPIIRFYFDSLNTNDFTPSATTTTITANPTEIVANGVSSSFITVQLHNVNGGVLNHSGHTITLNTSAGQLGSVIDNNDGTYTAYLTSSALVETATITGTLNGVDIVDSAEVKFTINTNPTNPTDPTELSNLVQAFSPNGDGKNDVWRILPNILTKYPDNSLNVFNRQGNLVYKAEPYKNDWDGVSNGKIIISNDTKLSIGAYYFVFNTGKDKVYKGWVYINY
ncbi:invasin domain 3-containing protein [Tenacibaculum sp. nBUS_03]|uniref:invasin domain 3-containing protein n=1 Tax=Tenacibaculum sp. nBUS_03 TaxID=3395320 RepID=UPI003EBEB07A